MKAVIFDMDGVLTDNRDLHVEAFRIWCERQGVELDGSKFDGVFGMGNRDIFPILLGHEVDTATADAYGEEKEVIYREIAADCIQPVAGLPEFLESLRKAGIAMAVGSSGMRKNVNMVLEKLRIKGYFSVIVDGDQLTKAKPDPEVYLKCASKLGVDPGECVVCEDAIAGIEAARRAGTKVIALATTLPRSMHSDYDLLADDFRGLNAATLRL